MHFKGINKRLQQILLIVADVKATIKHEPQAACHWACISLNCFSQSWSESLVSFALVRTCFRLLLGMLEPKPVLLNVCLTNSYLLESYKQGPTMLQFTLKEKAP